MSDQVLKKGMKEIVDYGATWVPVTCGKHAEDGFDPNCINCRKTATDTVNHVNAVKAHDDWTRMSIGTAQRDGISS